MPLLDRLPTRRPGIILADVDDTVAPSTQPISPAMVAALTRLHDAGSQLVFVSGGSVAQMTKQVSERLDRPHVLLGTSGAHAVRVTRGPAGPVQAVLFQHGFSDQERAEILAALTDLIERYNIRAETSLADQLQDRGCQFTLSALGRGAADAHKRAFDPDGSKRRAWVAHLASRLGEHRFELRVGGTSSIDITAKGVDKASGVRELLAVTGWRAKDGVYFGDRFEDSGNDNPVLAVMDCVAVHGPDDTLRHFAAWTGA